MKKYIYPMALTATLLATAACSDDEVNDIQQVPDSQKEQISFSMSDGSDASAMTRAGFTSATRILMRIQSDGATSSDVRYTRTVASAGNEKTSNGGQFTYSDVTFSLENGMVRYWDDAFGRDGKLSVYAVAIANVDNSTLLPINKFKDGEGTASSENVKTWGSSADNNIAWSVEKTAQTGTTIAQEDLVYSNNIQDETSPLGRKGRYVYNFATSNPKFIPDLTETVGTGNDFTDGRMQFTQKSGAATSDAGKFDKGHLDFKHALTRLTIQIIEGAGFNESLSTDFQWKTGTNISIAANGVSTAGTLNVKTGDWTSSAKDGIAKLAPIGKTYNSATGVYSGDYTDASGFYRAQFLPDYTFTNGNTTNVLSFNIDDNVYYVDQDMIFDALTATGATLEGQTDPIKMEQGKNYLLKITVNKTQIASMSATVEAWKDVVAVDQPLYNSYVTLNLATTTGDACDNFDLYRLVNQSSSPLTDQTSPTADNFFSYAWTGDYTDVAQTSENSGNGKLIKVSAGNYKTTWYWESNKDFYHFRTVNKGTSINTSAAKDNFAITSGAVATTDYHWGAPMKSGANLEYVTNESSTTRDGVSCSTEGYSGSIYKAIGSTTGNVAITEIHMMSNIYVTVQTVNNDGKVSLFNTESNTPTTVTLTKFSKTGTVDMGTGYVRPTTGEAIGDQLMTSPGSTSTAFFKSTSPDVSNYFSWAVVPQPLSRGTNDDDYIGITIQTPDHNQYYIVKKLSDITASSVTNHGSTTEITDPNQAKDAKITQWFPGHHYYYTFTISKKGIESITCTVANWIDVEAVNKDITLED